MKNAVWYLIFICLLAPNTFCSKAFSQLKPSVEETQQPAGDSVDPATAGEDASISNNEQEQLRGDESVDSEAASADNREGASTEQRESQGAETTKTTAEVTVPTPAAAARQTTITESTNDQTVPLNKHPTSPKPSSGTGLIIAGSIVTGIGGLILLAIPLCYVMFDSVDDDDDYDYAESIYGDDYEVESTFEDTEDNLRDICVIGSAIVGGAHVAVGLPLLIVGLSQRSDYNEWRKQNPEWAGLNLRIGDRSGIASWQVAF